MKNEQEERGYLDYESLCICLDIGASVHIVYTISIALLPVHLVTITGVLDRGV